MIVRVPGDEPIISRLRAELSSYRFRAIELPDRPARRTQALSQLAEQREAQAALRPKPEAMAIELWVRGNEELVNAGPARDPEVLALRVTEAMRARGLALPPLAAAGVKAPAADGDARKNKPAPQSDADVGVAEPRTLQPGEVTEPVVKPVESIKPAATKPSEPEPARPITTKPTEQTPVPPESKPTAPKPTEEPAKARAAELKAATKPAEPQQQPEVEAEASNPEPPQPSEVAAESGVAFQSPRDALLYAEVGPTGVISPGPDHLGPALDLLVSFTFRPYQTSSISLVGLIPLLTTDLLNDGASIDVRTYGIGGFGNLHLPLGRVELSAGLGGLGLICVTQAMPDQSAVKYMADQKTQRLAALLGRVGASVFLTRDLQVSASVMAGLTVQPLKVKPHAAEMDQSVPSIATWGRPLLLGSISIELALPWDR